MGAVLQGVLSGGENTEPQQREGPPDSAKQTLRDGARKTAK